uniref:HKT11 transporter n=1 Tax=Oryza glumipatula TaxID=40148 RepID=A0A0D9ZQE2_9ORYZ
MHHGTLQRVKHLHVFISMRLRSLSKCAVCFFRRCFWFFMFQSNPLIVQLVYFISISFVGFLALKILKPRHKPTPRDLDLMFTSVSTATVSSMATVEMEDFSNQQLWVLILLMILGGEVSISMLALHFNNAETNTNEVLPKRSPSTRRNIESFDAVNDSNQNSSQGFQSEATISLDWVQGSRTMKQKCRNMLAHIVTGYFIAAVVCSSLVIIIFAQIDSDTRQLLKSKDIKIWTFSIFTAVSSFANCGFTPVLAGNTILSPLLRLSIWILRKVSRREEYAYILQHPEDTGYRYLQLQKNSVNMVLTVGGLVLLQVMFLSYFEWNSKCETVNTRHAGEAVIDISTLSPPILVLFALVMYYPSDNSALPINADNKPLTERGRNSNDQAIWKNFIISKSACLAIFTIIACITERKSISTDPLNFNIFSIAFEIISAYANVGYSLGYSCERLLKLDATCKATSYGFVGKWTDEDTLKRIKLYIAMKLLLPNSEVLRIYWEKAQHLCGFLSMKLISRARCVASSVKQSYSFLNLKPQGKPGPKDLDLLFTSVSTLTVSSMATVEMEDLSDKQLWVLILLMLMGGEVFTSMLGLYFNNANANRNENSQRSLPSISLDIESNSPANNGDHKITECGQSEETMSQNQVQQNKSITYNPCAVLVRIVTDARNVLKSKEINMYTFCIFTAVSSFANCGFTPLNSNMQPFRKNWVLLLLVIPQILAGNTLFSPLLRLCVWVLGKVSGKAEYAYILQHPGETGYKHLHVRRNSVYIVLSVTGLILLQSVNTRQAGESILDISTLSPSTLLLFAVVMYLPSDASFLTANADNQPLTDKKTNSISRALWRNFTVNKLSCLAMFTFLACITERKSISSDPLNFNIFSIVFEIIRQQTEITPFYFHSAFGNVGYSLGYSCQKLLKPDATCKDASYGFVGRWTEEGKLIVILVMFLGRLKEFILK